MFSTNDDWDAGTEQDFLNQSLFGSETNAAQLLSFTKLLNSSQPNRDTRTTTTDKSNLNKRKLELVDTEQGGKKKKKKNVLAGDEKKVLFSVRVTKKKKISVNTCSSASEVENSVEMDCGEDCSKFNDNVTDQTVIADQLMKKKIKDEDDVKSLNENTLEKTAQNSKRKQKKRKRKVAELAGDDGLEKLSQVPGFGNSNADANTNTCSQLNDIKDFNELYSESDDASVTPMKKKKKGKEKGREGDVLVISDSALNTPKPTQNEQRQSTNSNDDKIAKLTTHKKKKVKKKEEPDNNTVVLTLPSLDKKHGDTPGNNVEAHLKPEEKPKKKKKKNAKGLRIDDDKQHDQPPAETPTTAAPLKYNPTKCSSSKYNKFQKKLMQKLKGGQFRWINERLYSCKSQEAENMFITDPNLFHIYHTGFHAQVQQWPQNPVDVMVEYVKQRGKDVVVADFGCGDAKLSSSVPNNVHSFDLVAINEMVTACDMRKVPLAAKSVDIAVFCLSLMGTNLVDFLTEARRVLKSGGVLKIAEVKSRFVDVEKFIADVSSLGFSLLYQEDSNKMFILLDFEKTSDTVDKTRRATDITLNPCIYKRR